MRACMWVRARARVCVCVRACVRACVRVRACVCECACVYVCVKKAIDMTTLLYRVMHVELSLISACKRMQFTVLF